MKDDELLTAPVTPKSAHLFEIWCPLSPLTLLDRYLFHRLTFYLAAYPLFSPLGRRSPPGLNYAANVHTPQFEQVVYRVP